MFTITLFVKYELCQHALIGKLSTYPKILYIIYEWHISNNSPERCKNWKKLYNIKRMLHVSCER